MNQTRIAREARDRLEATVEAFDVFVADGDLDRAERPTFRAMLHDALCAVRANDASDQLSRAIGRARDPRTIRRLTERYQQEIDEYPDAASAA